MADSDTPAILNDQYEFLEVLGHGSFGSVHKIRRLRDGQIFACKTVHYGKFSAKEKELLVSEVNILRGLSHPNIVRYVDRALDRQHSVLYIIMEFCGGGDLAGYIKRHRTTGRNGHTPAYAREEVIWNVAAQSLLALDYCHSRVPPVLHRDLKPGNLFFTADLRVKLGDFGLARTLDPGACATTNVGTPLYMSPEQTKGLPYDEKCDVWSLGCVLYELAALAPPFTARSQPELYERIRRGNPPPIPDHYSSSLKRLVEQMLRLDPTRRPSAAQLLELPALKGYCGELAALYKKDDLARREAALAAREADVAARERVLREREARVAAREAKLARLDPGSGSLEPYRPEF